MKNLDFERSNLDKMMNDYEPLLCVSCKEKLRIAAEPLKNVLDEGKTPNIRHLQKLLRVICPVCINAIIKKKG